MKENRRPQTPLGAPSNLFKTLASSWLAGGPVLRSEKGTQESNGLLKEEHQVPLENLSSSFQTLPPARSPLSQSLLGQMSQSAIGRGLRAEFRWLSSRMGTLSSSWVLLLHQNSLFPSPWVPNKSTSSGIRSFTQSFQGEAPISSLALQFPG